MSEKKYIKFLDYSSFEYDTFTLPKKNYPFFNIDDSNVDKVDIILIDENDNRYNSYIRYTDKSRENSPTRLLKWNKDFTSYLKKKIPNWIEIKKGEKSENFKLIFEPTEDKSIFKIFVKSSNSLVEDKSKRYFVFSTGLPGFKDDIDFETYPWERSRFNKVREGDFFVYKKSSNVSENKKLYFFGMGQIGSIHGDNKVVGKIINPIKFSNIVHQDDLDDYEWEWKSRGENWSNFFNHYGMDIIPFKDFEYICQLGMNNQFKIDFKKENQDLIESHKNIYFSDRKPNEEDKYSLQKSRGNDQKVFSDRVNLIYDYKCCVTGIKTKGMNHGSHISPWKSDKENRLNPKNGLLLSLLIHKCFDEGIISIDDNYRVILSSRIDDNELLVYLKKYENKKINLPIRKDFYPDKDLLKIHRKKFGFN